MSYTISESEVTLMTLVDSSIRELISGNILYNDSGLSPEAMLASVGAVSYDLHTKSFVNNGEIAIEGCDLEPGASVFVCTAELVNLPEDLIARVVIRNSRLRQGFALEAPVYQPGHHTRIYFRLTNISSKRIALSNEFGYAALMFERLPATPSRPYAGTFQSELSYSDMAEYTSAYNGEYSIVKDKINEVKHLERNIYANVLTLMSIFIALFSLINVNVDVAFARKVALSRLVISNLITIGSISFLVSLIQLCLARSKRALWIWMLVASLVMLTGAAALTLL